LTRDSPSITLASFSSAPTCRYAANGERKNAHVMSGYSLLYKPTC
jgi:hypothetical protein